MSSGLSRPVAAFERARDYDGHAAVQREVADWLADDLRAAPRPARLLEVGAGTGFLREAAGPLADDWLLTDLSPAMLARARHRLAGRADVRFGLLDAASPDLDERFDLVVGSLVVQWFDDLAAGLSRLFALVAPGGRLVVTTLSAGSFAEWRRAHEAEGLVAATRPYPPLARLAALRLEGMAPDCAARAFPQDHPDGWAFLRGLKAIGAGTPHAGHHPLPPGALRRVVARWEASGRTICYEVAMLSFTRPAA